MTRTNSYIITIAEDATGKKFMRYAGAFVPASGGMITTYLSRFPDIDYVEFNSQGGVLLEINGPGSLLRDMAIPFIVKKGDVCVSACAFLALYSPDIKLDGLLAFHLPYRTTFAREITLYGISQSMVERTLRMSRQMFENDWLLYLYLTVVRESDMKNYVVFDDISELEKYKMTDKSQFMDPPKEKANIIIMNAQELLTYARNN